MTYDQVRQFIKEAETNIENHYVWLKTLYNIAIVKPKCGLFCSYFSYTNWNYMSSWKSGMQLKPV